MEKYKIGLALSGGGAKAAAHCGALQALSERGIRPDILAGTSAGALAAVLFSAGIPPRKIIDIFTGMSFFKDIVYPTRPWGGLFDSAPLIEHIRKHVPYQRLEDLPIPTYVVASDLEQGCVRVFKEGELAPRVVASCSIPVVFKPMVIDGHHYVDGGVFMNLPISAIRDSCEKVIALNLNYPTEEKYHHHLISVASRSFELSIVSNALAEIPLADVYAELDTQGASIYDLSKVPDLFTRGYQSMVKVLDSI